MQTVKAVGGSFSYFKFNSWPDCSPGIPDPPETLLKCLDFTLPSSFNGTVGISGLIVDYSINGTFSTLLNFTSSDPVCGEASIGPRLATASFAFVQDESGRRRHDPPYCSVYWISDQIPTLGMYALDYKNPACGPMAPVLLDDNEKFRERLAVVKVTKYGDIIVRESWDKYKATYGSAYGVGSDAVSDVKVLSKSKFSFSVTSNVSSPTNANSCVYTYNSLTNPGTSQKYVLDTYTLGSLSLQNGTDINDGCITLAISSDFGQFQFTNTSEACGPNDPTSRFQRYFGGDKNVVYNALTVGSGVFNVSSGEPSSNIPRGRRDADDASFQYHVKESIQTITSSASTTVISTSSFATFTSTSSVAVSTVTSTSVAASNISYSSRSSLSVTSTVSTSNIAVSTIAANSNAVSATSSTAALTNNSKSLTAAGELKVGASTMVTTVTSAVSSTDSVAPNVLPAQNTYGVSAGNNIYKGDATGLVGVFAAFITAVVFAL
ncbi:hypothetical protein BCR33DRAFT_785007 [Rhizoclosmatium globosum]|uniref:Uncharacterized protein n=1 Tax=Rhizoclosmatium globosum TaxID=329046 RepID=A0A1Y2CB95_9FUNG|nr:hypothetical protein BCR33DRAFT_785007 [Rhizoclosmatium globosum]|eukprot:ORY44303.1 hypothetical protein BCR33DRAFT_785007 [Rhizoclosmatium globosum]